MVKFGPTLRCKEVVPLSSLEDMWAFCAIVDEIRLAEEDRSSKGATGGNVNFDRENGESVFCGGDRAPLSSAYVDLAVIVEEKLPHQLQDPKRKQAYILVNPQ